MLCSCSMTRQMVANTVDKFPTGDHGVVEVVEYM